MNPHPDQPIGVFDSGVGGLTVLHALVRQLPAENLLYLGDTARVPYGTRSPETIVRYATRVASHLWQRGIKALVIACNTATTHALPALTAAGERVGIPVIGVLRPGVEEAARRTKSKNVAVIGTEGTIRSGRYQAELAALGIAATGLACPLFVALAEEGWVDNDVAALVARRYLGQLSGGPDTLILGCTHYPLLRGVISAALPGVDIVDSAEATARTTETVLAARGLLRAARSPGEAHYLVTDNLPRFIEVGTRFLGRPPEPAEVVDLTDAVGPFRTDG